MSCITIFYFALMNGLRFPFLFSQPIAYQAGTGGHVFRIDYKIFYAYFVREEVIQLINIFVVVQGKKSIKTSPHLPVHWEFMLFSHSILASSSAVPHFTDTEATSRLSVTSWPPPNPRSHDVAVKRRRPVACYMIPGSPMHRQLAMVN